MFFLAHSILSSLVTGSLAQTHIPNFFSFLPQDLFNHIQHVAPPDIYLLGPR